MAPPSRLCQSQRTQLTPQSGTSTKEKEKEIHAESAILNSATAPHASISISESNATISRISSSILTNSNPSTIIQQPTHSPSLSNTQLWASAPPPIPAWCFAPIPNRPGPYANSALEPSGQLMDMEKLYIPAEDRAWCREVNVKVRDFHAHIDSSHNYEHILRVCAIALRLYEAETAASREGVAKMDTRKLFVGMMVHDIGDAKYLSPEEKANGGGETKTKALLREAGCPEDMVHDIWRIADAVSFTAEQKDPRRVWELIHGSYSSESDHQSDGTFNGVFPELAIVQDADRLDGLGALGIGRCFAFGGYEPSLRHMSLDRAMQMVWTRFWIYLGCMKTAAGREEAERRWGEMVGFWEMYRREADVGTVLEEEDQEEEGQG